MNLIRGITVTLINHIPNGENPAGEIIYKEEKKKVENILVAPASADDLINKQSLDGTKTIYTIAIPKGDKNHWEGQKVIFFGKTWKVFTEAMEGMEDMIPLSWNKKYLVERYE